MPVTLYNYHLIAHFDNKNLLASDSVKQIIIIVVHDIYFILQHYNYCSCCWYNSQQAINILSIPQFVQHVTKMNC